MCSLILCCLFSLSTLYTKDLLKYKNRVTKNRVIKLVLFIKKNCSYKEKSGTVTKVK